MEAVIDDNQRQALEMFGFRASVPLFVAIGEDAAHLATGTFVAVGRKSILLTARHIFDSCAPEQIAIATSPEGSILRTLGKSVIHRPIDQPGTEIDIVAIEILDLETIDIVKAGWRAVDVAIGEDAKANGELVIIGYQTAMLNKKGSRIAGRPTGIFTKLMDNIPSDSSPPTDPNLDLFCHLSPKAMTMAGTIIDIPPIHGMSGCAIWQLREVDMDELWIPDRALRLVGIQSAARSGSYLRGKRWSYIRNLLEQVT